MAIHLLTTLQQSSRDIRLLWFSVFARMVAFGLTNQVLTLYLKSLGIPEHEIGFFMTLTMIGDSILSYFLTWNSDKIGNRRIMKIGSFLMLACGAVFGSGTSKFSVLLTAAVFGVISPSGGDTGPFKTIEEAVLAKLTPPNHRPEVYAVHGTLAAIGSAIGNTGTGFFVQGLIDRDDFTYRRAYCFCFIPFCAISLIKYITMLFLSDKCEAGYTPKFEQADNEQTALVPETSPRVVSEVEHTTATGLSPQSQNVLFKLLVPFMIDSFGWGFMPTAWVVYYFKVHYVAPAAVLGLVFGSTDLIQSVSSIPSAYFSKHLGPVTSSVLIQIPCGIFFMLIPILGSTLPRGAFLYLLNQATTAFDVVPRQILLTSLIPSGDLPKVMGTVNIAKQAARAISPCFTGILAESHYLWICFLISGSCLILSNIILGFTFSGVDEEIRRKEHVDHVIEH